MMTTQTTSLHKHRELWIALGLFVITIACFWRASTLGFLNYDDDEFVTKNQIVQSGLTLNGVAWAFTSTQTSSWLPLTRLSHMLDCELFGQNPRGHHLMSVTLHAANVALLFLVFFRMSGAASRSALVAAIFALHPLRVESVAWVAERKDVLSAFFGLLAMLSYVRYVKAPSVGRYALVALWFALSLMAKPMLVTLPFVLLLLDYWPLRRVEFDDEFAVPGTSARQVRRLVVEKIPLFLLALAVSIVTFLVQQRGGAMIFGERFSFAERLSNAIVSYVQYLIDLFWPVGLAVLYPFPQSIPPWVVIGAAVILLTISALCIVQFKRRPYLIVGWLWYLGMLVPVIGLVQVGEQARADRYTYLPLIGVLVMLIWSVPMAWARTVSNQRRNAVPAVAAVVIAALFVLTQMQLRHWTDGIQLFEHAVAVTDVNPAAHRQLALAYGEAGRTEDEYAQYQEALRLRPNDAIALVNMGDILLSENRHDEAIQHFLAATQQPGFARAHYNLGVALTATGQFEQAIAAYRQAVQIQPDLKSAHSNLGSLLQQFGDVDGAIAEFREELRHDPDSVEAHFNLGVVLASKGEMDEAIEHWRETVRLRPEMFTAHQRLGNALAVKGRMEEAAEHYRAVIKIEPTHVEAQNNLGAVLSQLGQTDEAITRFELALKLNPEYADALINLADVLTSRGEVDRALESYALAVQARPNIAALHNRMGVLLQRQNRLEEAAKQFEEALRIDPNFAGAQERLNQVRPPQP